MVRTWDVKKAVDLGEELAFKFVHLHIGHYSATVLITPQNFLNFPGKVSFQLVNGSCTLILKSIKVNE